MGPGTCGDRRQPGSRAPGCPRQVPCGCFRRQRDGSCRRGGLGKGAGEGTGAGGEGGDPRAERWPCLASAALRGGPGLGSLDFLLSPGLGLWARASLTLEGRAPRESDPWTEALLSTPRSPHPTRNQALAARRLCRPHPSGHQRTRQPRPEPCAHSTWPVLRLLARGPPRWRPALPSPPSASWARSVSVALQGRVSALPRVTGVQWWPSPDLLVSPQLGGRKSAFQLKQGLRRGTAQGQCPSNPPTGRAAPPWEPRGTRPSPQAPTPLVVARGGFNTAQRLAPPLAPRAPAFEDILKPASHPSSGEKHQRTQISREAHSGPYDGPSGQAEGTSASLSSRSHGSACTLRPAAAAQALPGLHPFLVTSSAMGAARGPRHSLLWRPLALPTTSLDHLKSSPPEPGCPHAAPSSRSPRGWDTQDVEGCPWGAASPATMGGQVLTTRTGLAIRPSAPEQPGLWASHLPCPAGHREPRPLHRDTEQGTCVWSCTLVCLTWLGVPAHAPSPQPGWWGVCRAVGTPRSAPEVGDRPGGSWEHLRQHRHTRGLGNTQGWGQATQEVAIVPVRRWSTALAGPELRGQGQPSRPRTTGWRKDKGRQPGALQGIHAEARDRGLRDQPGA